MLRTIAEMTPYGGFITGSAEPNRRDIWTLL